MPRGPGRCGTGADSANPKSTRESADGCEVQLMSVDREVCWPERDGQEWRSDCATARPGASSGGARVGGSVGRQPTAASA